MASPPFLLSRRHLAVTRNSGSIAALTSTTWANVDTSSDIVIPAAVGDDWWVQASGRWGTENQSAFLSAGTWNGSTLVNFLGSGEPTTSTGDGVPSWRCNPLTGQDVSFGGGWVYTVAAGDIVVDTNLGPQVTMRLRYRVSGSKTLSNSSTIPFQWVVVNIGPAYGSNF